MDKRFHSVEWGDNGTRRRTKTWGEPHKWNQEAWESNEIRRVFCASLADIFEDRDELIPWRKDLFDLIDDCYMLAWLILTKRPENVRRFWPMPKIDATAHQTVTKIRKERYGVNRRPNVWLGSSVSDQDTFNEWLPRLAALRPFVRKLFLSIEPQVSPITLNFSDPPPVDWVIVGGESGRNARPFDVRWAHSIVEECRSAKVPVFVKQLGANVVGGKIKDKKGGDINEFPREIQVREFP